MSAPSAPSWMRPVGLGALGVAGAAAAAHLLFGVGSGGTFPGAVAATIFDPLVFLGLPLAWYLLRQVGRVRIAERRELARRRVEGDVVVRPLLQHEFRMPSQAAPQFPGEPAESSFAGVFLGGIVCAFLIGMVVGMVIATRWDDRSAEQAKLDMTINMLNFQADALAAREEQLRQRAGERNDQEPVTTTVPALEEVPIAMKASSSAIEQEPGNSHAIEVAAVSVDPAGPYQNIVYPPYGPVTKVVVQDGKQLFEAKLVKSVEGTKSETASILRSESESSKVDYLGEATILRRRGDVLVGFVEGFEIREGDHVVMPPE